MASSSRAHSRGREQDKEDRKMPYIHQREFVEEHRERRRLRINLVSRASKYAEAFAREKKADFLEIRNRNDAVRLEAARRELTEPTALKAVENAVIKRRSAHAKKVYVTVLRMGLLIQVDLTWKRLLEARERNKKQKKNLYEANLECARACRRMLRLRRRLEEYNKWQQQQQHQDQHVQTFEHETHQCEITPTISVEMDQIGENKYRGIRSSMVVRNNRSLQPFTAAENKKKTNRSIDPGGPCISLTNNVVERRSNDGKPRTNQTEPRDNDTEQRLTEPSFSMSLPSMPIPESQESTEWKDYFDNIDNEKKSIRSKNVENSCKLPSNNTVDGKLNEEKRQVRLADPRSDESIENAPITERNERLIEPGFTFPLPSMPKPGSEESTEWINYFDNIDSYS